MFLVAATSCCANVVLQFVPEGVEACWVGEKDAGTGDPVPIPQPYEEVEPDCLVTGCAFCMNMFADALGEKDAAEKVALKDLAEILYEAV